MITNGRSVSTTLSVVTTKPIRPRGRHSEQAFSDRRVLSPAIGRPTLGFVVRRSVQVPHTGFPQGLLLCAARMPRAVLPRCTTTV
jgi:hypothetical protein